MKIEINTVTPAIEAGTMYNCLFCESIFTLTPILVNTLCTFARVVDTSIRVSTTFLLSSFEPPTVVTSPTASVTTKSHCAYKSSFAQTTTVAVPLLIAVIYRLHLCRLFLPDRKNNRLRHLCLTAQPNSQA